MSVQSIHSRILQSIVVLGGCVVSTSVLAHEKWFPLDIHGIERPELLSSWNATNLSILFVSLTTIVVMVLAQFALQRMPFGVWWETMEIRFFRPLQPWTSTIIRILTGIVFVGLSAQHALIAINFSLEDFPGFLKTFLLITQAIIGISFILGFFVRVTSALFIALFFAAMFLFPPIDVLDDLLLLGIALYLFVNGRGRFSLDEHIWTPDWQWVKKSITLSFSPVNTLRIIAGFNFLYLGSHKISSPNLIWPCFMIIHF